MDHVFSHLYDMKLKKLTFQIAVITILSVMSGLTFNAISEKNVSLFYAPLNIKSGSHISLEQVLQLFSHEKALFIDTRYIDEYKKSHIRGALNLPLKSSREEISAFCEPIPKDQVIVVYCSGPECHSSRRLGGYLSFLGFKKVYIYLAGFKEWEAQNLPMEVDQAGIRK